MNVPNQNSNTTIAPPWSKGGWQVLWGSGGPHDWKTFQLDIVGFLAVLGESSVTANAQVSALSRLFYLPRLLPAPQALLPPTRPNELPSTKAWVTGVQSGNSKEHIHHVANILLGEDLKPFDVRCVSVTKPKSRKLTWLDTVLRGVPNEKKDSYTPTVTAKAGGPLAWVTLTGFLLSIALLTLSVLLGDGYSVIATLLLSFLSTLIGIANRWTLRLPKKPGESSTTEDTVIRYPNGSFLIVRCVDEIARELYFAPEQIEYYISKLEMYRLISLIGTLILMLGIIFLANARLELQFAWAGAYGLINAAHWAAAAVPAKQHWDLTCYTREEQGIAGGPHNSTFTEALWKTILVTKNRRWVRNGDNAAPATDVWDDWLVDAEYQAKLAGSSVGKLVDPVPDWRPKKSDGQFSEKATIWLQPENWDPREAWARIDREKNPPQNGGTGPSRAV